MKTIEEHIDKDKHLIEDPTISAAARRHYKDELHELEVYAEHHKEEIEAGDHHCLLYTSPSPRDTEVSRMPSSA